MLVFTIGRVIFFVGVYIFRLFEEVLSMSRVGSRGFRVVCCLVIIDAE